MQEVKEVRIIKDAALKVNGKVEVKEFYLSSANIERDLKQMSYKGEGLIKDEKVENAKLPPINYSFYKLVYEQERIPSIDDLIETYSKNFVLEKKGWSINGKLYSKEGILGRVQRTYPSLIRDLHFMSLCFEKGYFDKVRFSLVDDYYKGVDLRIDYDQYEFELALHIDSSRGRFYKRMKYSRRDYDSKKEIVLTLDKTKMRLVSNFYLYKEEHVDQLLELIQSKLDAEEEILKSIKRKEDFDPPFSEPANPKFKYIDLFAGIGGFHVAMNDLGGECVFSSEWDRPAQKTYYHNFGTIPFGDITSPSVKNAVPEDFDLLCAGFPCQAFSIAGRRGGFEDTRGTLFFDVAEIIKRRQPKALFLENVKGLRNHDKGRTLSTILNVLRNDLNYFVPEPEIINAKDFGVPQNRERIFIVGFRNDLDITDFKYPEPTGEVLSIEEVLEEKPVSPRYYLSKRYLQTLEEHKARHEGKGNGFGFMVIDHDKVANAVVCGGMGRERNLVEDFRQRNLIPETNIKGEINDQGIRKMTPREWARLQGFPDKFRIPVSDTQAYKQFGNSVAVPAIRATAKEVLKCLSLNIKMP